MLFAAAGAAIQWFWAWRWDGVSFKSNPPAPAMDVPTSGCTVVSCFHNEAPNVADFALGLKPALQTARAKGMSVEVVTVNHGSTDETGELLEKEAGQENHWQVVHASRTRAGKKEALALGVAAASAPLSHRAQSSRLEGSVALQLPMVFGYKEWLREMTRVSKAMDDATFESNVLAMFECFDGAASEPAPPKPVCAGSATSSRPVV